MATAIYDSDHQKADAILGGPMCFIRDQIAAAVATERERCALIAECNMPRNEPGEYARGRFAAADAIRRASQ
jgi:hypothetical protein